MTDVRFTVLDVVAETYSAVPLLTARLGIEETTGEAVHAIALRCQVRIEPQRRGYGAIEDELLRDIFGRRTQWSDTVRPFLWLHTSTLVQGFDGVTEADLPLPVTYDFEVSASKYLHALRDGVVPLSLLFSGTVFTRGATGFAVAQVPWDAEASYRMPVAVWQQVMDLHWPDSTWLRVGRDRFEQLQRFRVEHGLLDWDETVATLMERAGQVTP